MSDSDDKSPIGSPPLILACLAIGVFSAALISIFGWRRMQIARGVGHRRIGGQVVFDRHGLDSWGNLRERPGIGDEPIMWEVWTDRNARVTNVDYGCWDQVMPLALHSSPPEYPNHVSTAAMNLLALSATSLPPTAERRRPFRDFTPSSLFPLYRRTATLSPSLPTDTAEDSKEDEVVGFTEVVEKKQTQVVIVVEMPSWVSSRRRHDQPLFGRSEYLKHHSHDSAFSKSDTLVETHDKTREELSEFNSEEGKRQYCIGVHSCPSPVSTKLKEDKKALRTIQNC